MFCFWFYNRAPKVSANWLSSGKGEEGVQDEQPQKDEDHPPSDDEPKNLDGDSSHRNEATPAIGPSPKGAEDGDKREEKGASPSLGECSSPCGPSKDESASDGEVFVCEKCKARLQSDLDADATCQEQ
jgi:hypothetical protein